MTLLFAMPLREAIEQRYPDQSDQARTYRERIIEICRWYLDSGFGDDNAEERLSSQEDNRYWQVLSEVLLAHQLSEAGIPIAHQNVGPDFRIDVDGRRIWIEVITPTAATLPAEWLAPTGSSGGARDFPHEAILLRWTAAIKEKAEALIGNDAGRVGYLANGVVGRDDVYVIAVNGRLLRGFGGGFAELIGISQFPFAVEATFGVGPLQVRINRVTLEAGEPEHQERFFIERPARQPVPADTFLDTRFTPISAIWATDVDEASLLGGVPGMIVVHNPNAANALPQHQLPAQDEYVARSIDDERYQLDRIDGIARRTDQIEVDVG